MPAPADHQQVGVAGLLDQHLDGVPVADLGVDFGARRVRGHLADRVPEDGRLVVLDLLVHGLRGVAHRRLTRSAGVMPGQQRPDWRSGGGAVPDGPAQRRNRPFRTVHAHDRGRPCIAFARHASCLPHQAPQNPRAAETLIVSHASHGR